MQLEPSQTQESTMAASMYRSRPVTVAVDPVSLVISECISITSEIRKRVPSTHSSVSAILGRTPNTVHLGQPSRSSKPGKQPSETRIEQDIEDEDLSLTNRWVLRGRNGVPIRENPLISSFSKLRYELSGVKGVVFHLDKAPR